MDGLAHIAALTPSPPDWRVDRNALSRSPLALYASELMNTQQNPVHHGEGDVWRHTLMVCDALAGMPAFRALDARGRSALFAAALLHDIGKARVTRWEGGCWKSPGHAAVGERMARELLWTRLGFCGTPEKIAFREAVCALIRHHSLPVHIIDDAGAERRLRAVSALALLAPGFTLERLCMLARSDAEGKICADLDEQLERVELCALLAREVGCLLGPYPFSDAHTRFAYLSGRGVAPDYPLFDDCWGPVILLCGLPGTGKDTWIASNAAGMSVVSLDAIRRELGIAPTDQQGPVAQEARRRAREYLRRREPFIWNATNITAQTRSRVLSLIHSYRAWVRIVYLETDLEEELRRNAARAARVPESVIFALLAKLTPPTLDEAREVKWLSV